MKNVALLLAGMGVFLLGLAAMIYVIRGPHTTAQERLTEKIMRGDFLRPKPTVGETKSEVPRSTLETTEAK